jgi:predicted RNA-binding protein YlxR (DUF448 family)
MKTLSLKLKDPIFSDVEAIVAKLERSRNAYINEAIEHYNKLQKRRLLAKQLEEECRIVADADYEVLKEMEMLDDEIFE